MILKLTNELKLLLKQFTFYSLVAGIENKLSVFPAEG